MVKKLQKTNTSKKSPVQLSGSVKDSAQQIWLAGLAAFTKAQNEGGKVFETLAKEGLSIQRKTQAAAEAWSPVADRIWNDSDDPLYAKRHEDKSQGMADSDMHKFEKQGRTLKNGD